MKIVTISWVRNEGDILETFVRYHCQFVDRMIIVDHRSQDGSRDILQQLQREGLPIDWWLDDRLLHEQQAVLSQLVQEVMIQDAPDWILPLDADEFFCAVTGHPREVLAQQSTAAVLSLPWHGYVPTPRDDSRELNVLTRMTYRRSVERPQWYKVVLPGRRAAESAVALAYGNHAVIDRASGKVVPPVVSSELFLAHFPVRSVRQLQRKVYGGWLSHLADPERAPGATFQWQALFDRFRQGGDVSSDELMQLGIDYATYEQWERLPPDVRAVPTNWFEGVTPAVAAPPVVVDPITAPFAVVYPPADLEPLTVLIASAEALAGEYRRLRSGLNFVGESTQRLSALCSSIRFRWLQPTWRLPPPVYALLEQRWVWPQYAIDRVSTVLPLLSPARRRALYQVAWMPKMSTLAVGAIINECVRHMDPAHAYLNIGVWHGYSLLVGMVGNTAKRCIGVDNFSEFGGPRAAFLRRFERRKAVNQVFYDSDWREYLRTIHRGPVGVFFYDATHDERSHYEALVAAEPFFVRGTLILVDDTNWPGPRDATLRFLRERGGYRVIFDARTSGNCHPTFWNGLLLIEKWA